MVAPPAPLLQRAYATYGSENGESEEPFCSASECGECEAMAAQQGALAGKSVNSIWDSGCTCPHNGAGTDADSDSSCSSGSCDGRAYPETTPNPIHLARGAVVEGAIDLALPGPVFSWSHTRNYDSGNVSSTTGRNLFWVGSDGSRPYLSNTTGDEVNLIQTASSYRAFTGTAPTLDSPLDYDATMAIASVTDSDDLDNDMNDTETIDVYTLVEHSTGRVLIFLGFDADVAAEYRGRMVERTTVEYQADGLRGIAYAYNSDELISVVTTASPQTQRIDYTYTTAGGQKQVDKIEVRDGPLVTDTVVKKAEYTYYDEVSPTNSALGSDGDLVQVKISQLASDNTTWMVRYTQYRYFTSSDSEGKSHQIKMVFEPDAVERAIDNEAGITDADDMLSEADSLVDDYSSRSFTYYTVDLDTDNLGYDSCITPWYGSGEDLNTKYGGSEFDEYNDTELYGAVKTETVGGCASCGGTFSSAKHTYFYMDLNGGSSTDPNDVVRIVVEDTEDGANPRTTRYRQIWGLNFKSAAIRETLIEDPTQTTLKAWCESKKLNSDLRVTEHRMPSAHSGVDTNAEIKKFLNPTSSTNDTDTVSSSAGVVYYYEYSTSFSDGMRPTGKLVRQGAGTGSRYYVSATDWGDGTNDKPTHLKTAEYVYPSQTTTRADSSRIKTAAYTYTFWDASDTAIKQITTTLPTISTSQNGSGTSTTTSQYYDEEGRLRWTKDGEGYVNYYSYHADFGGKALQVLDVNTSSLNSDITGTGSGKWVAWSGAAGLTRASGLPTALELTTKQGYDDQGRNFKTVDAGGSEHYTRRETNKTMSFSFWTGDTSGSAELPVQVVETDDNGRVTEGYAVKPSKSQWDSTNGLPKLASYTSADYVARVVNNYDATSGRLSSVDRYYDADAGSGGYYRTTYLYDDMGRQGATIQEVASSKYHVTATLYDVLGLTRTASDDEIRRAYKRQRDVFRDGSFPAASVVTERELRAEQARIEEAYDTLLDPNKRRSYELSTFPAEAKEVEQKVRQIDSARAAELAMLQAEVAREVTAETQFTGKLLRKVRESQGVEIADIAQRTKISGAHLRAIEAEAIADLPAMVYVQGFVQEVAKFLKLDPTQVSRTLVRRLREIAARQGDAGP